MEVVGKEDVDYMSKKTNRQVQGVRLHCLVDDSRVTGKAAESIFISGTSDCIGYVKGLKIGDLVTVVYNRFGSVESVMPCPTK